MLRVRAGIVDYIETAIGRSVRPQKRRHKSRE